MKQLFLYVIVYTSNAQWANPQKAKFHNGLQVPLNDKLICTASLLCPIAKNSLMVDYLHILWCASVKEKWFGRT